MAVIRRSIVRPSEIGIKKLPNAANDTVFSRAESCMSVNVLVSVS